MIGFDSEWCPCGCGYYLACVGSTSFANRAATKAYLQSFEPGAVGMVAHAGLNDYQTLGYYPTHVDCYDSFTLAWLLDENGKHGLKELAPRYLGRTLEDPIKFNEKTGQVEFFGTHIPEANQADVLRYCNADAEAARDLAQHCLARLPKKVLSWYREVEQPLEHCLYEAYERGVGVDVAALDAELAAMERDVPVARGLVFQATGYEFQLSSAATAELEHVLYDDVWERSHDHRGVVGYYKSCAHGKQPDKCKAEDCSHLPRERTGWVPKTYPGLGLPCAKRTPKGGRACDEEALLHHVSNPVVKAVLDYRELVKVHQFLLSWKKFLRDGRLHCRMQSAGAVTGRFSHRDPNLAQVPKRGVLGKRMRSLFIPAPGMSLVVCDQDSVEARLLCAFAREEAELVRFRNGEDVHQALAGGLSAQLGLSVSRDAAKTTRYALLYGAGPKRLAATLSQFGIPTTEATAKKLIKAFYAVLPNVQKWQQAVEASAASLGTVQTIGGRVRHLLGAWSYDQGERQRAMRQAGNTVVQGSAADLTKLWMVGLHALGVPVILSVHDEVLVECRPELAKTYCKAIEETLAKAGERLGLKVPITGTAQEVSSWGQKN